jgi:hypothetical protein
MYMISKIVDWVYPLGLDPNRTPEAVLEKRGYTIDPRGNVHARVNGIIREDEHNQMMEEAKKPNFRKHLEDNQREMKRRVEKLIN